MAVFSAKVKDSGYFIWCNNLVKNALAKLKHLCCPGGQLCNWFSRIYIDAAYAFLEQYY
jgi:hypothetical protein